jgi:uncharacterized protein YbjT (DUF2867 family)
MILIAGGTGSLGTRVVRLLSARGLEVRILTRDPARAEHLRGDLVEVVAGDVRDARAVERAVAGAQTVISATQGFAGADPAGPRAVDRQGNSNLIRAAKAGAAEHFVLVSVQGAAQYHPMELFRMKYLAEQELKESGLPWTIIRPAAYMETWSALIGEPLLRTGKTRIFGRGENPINFVSAYDVARFVELAVVDPVMRGALVEVGGPENLSMRQVAQTFETVTGKAGKKSHVPLPMMRLMALLMRPVNSTLARQIQAGVVMDTHDFSFDPSETSRRYPSIPLTSLAEVVRRDYADPIGK